MLAADVLEAAALIAKRPALISLRDSVQALPVAEREVGIGGFVVTVPSTKSAQVVTFLRNLVQADIDALDARLVALGVG